MQKQVLIALAIVGALTTGFFLLKNQPTNNTATATVDTDALKDIYNQWKAEYKINVGAAEDDFRFRVFTNTYAEIQQHNSESDRTFDMGLNQFSHLTQEEFAATRLGLKVDGNRTRNGSTDLSLTATNDAFLPLTATATATADADAQVVDWTKQMNPIRNQGQCESCWAFSAVGALEGLHSVTKGAEGLKIISEQELIDCSRSYQNDGCSGGRMDYAFKYVIDAKGLALGSEYPYKGVDGKCQAGNGKTTRNVVIKGFAYVKENSTDALKAAIARQPVTVAVAAGSSIFQNYKSGIISSASCGTHLDHGVVAVGFDTTGKIPFYRVRNSWGAKWGDNGHVNIAIVDGPGICGIQMDAIYPTL